MEQVIRVFLADQSQDYLELLRAEIELQPDLTVTDAVRDGEEAYARLAAQAPDVLVTNLLLPGLDGLSLLRRLKNEGKLPHTLVVSGFVTDHMAQALSLLGVDDYLSKPCQTERLICRIREAASPSGRRVIRDYDPAIREALIRVGAEQHLSGYRYLAEGVRRTLEDRNVLHGITKILYPDLAKQFGTTPSCVERAIRGVVVKAWDRTTAEQRHDYFKGLFDGYEAPPSNAPFISAVAEFIRLRYEKRDAWKSE